MKKFSVPGDATTTMWDFFSVPCRDGTAKVLKEKGVKHYEHRATVFVDIHCYPIFRIPQVLKREHKAN